MNLEKVSITLSGSEDPKKELDIIMNKIKALPLVFCNEKGDEIETKVKFAKISGSGINIEPAPKVWAKEINFEVIDDSCVKFEKRTPGFLKLVYDETVFFVILKTEKN